jgi:hypothetical protein
MEGIFMRDIESRSGVYEQSSLLEYNKVCLLANCHKRFGGTCCLHFQGLCSTKRKLHRYWLRSQQAAAKILKYITNNRRHIPEYLYLRNGTFFSVKWDFVSYVIVINVRFQRVNFVHTSCSPRIGVAILIRTLHGQIRFNHSRHINNRTIRKDVNLIKRKNKIIG